MANHDLLYQPHAKIIRSLEKLADIRAHAPPSIKKAMSISFAQV
jgi:hypothetical protein